MMEVKARLRHVRISPKKMRLVANAIKGMEVLQAIVRLQFIRRNSAPILLKLLKSAVANAKHNNALDVENLVVKQIIVNKGVDLKRSRPAAFGSAHPFHKHSAHVDLTLGLKAGVAEPKQAHAKTGKKVPTVAVDSVAKATKQAGHHPEAEAGKRTKKEVRSKRATMRVQNKAS